MHEANGFVPVSLYSAMVSCASFSRSWPYFFWSALTLGCSSCMLRLDLICLTKSGISNARMTTVRPTIDSAHAAPEVSGNTWLHNQCQPTRTALVR